jgi:hypothetical protein
MNPWKVKLITLMVITAVALLAFSTVNVEKTKKKPFIAPKGCVFRTLMGEESSENHFYYKTPEKIQFAIDRGLSWIARAQNENGGWGAGSHARQNITDPHAVPTDPATTAMVAMALLRSGSTLKAGEYSEQVNKALLYLLNAVETSDRNSPTITTETGTQIQIKLGQNIDVILTSQFLSNILDYTKDNFTLTDRIKKAQDICVSKIQR